MTDDSENPPRFQFKHGWYRTAKILGLLAVLVFFCTPLLADYGLSFDLLIGMGGLLLLAASIAIGLGLSQNWPRV